jgi:hypothetical protein
MYSQYFIHHVQPLPDWSSLGASLIQPALLIALFALSMGLSVSLLVEDYLVRMREYLFRSRGVEWSPGDQRIIYKLGLAFVAVSVVPLTLFIFRAFAMDDTLGPHGLREREFIRSAFGKFVPAHIASMVLKERGIVRPVVREGTILFSDIEGFTAISEKLRPDEILAMLNEYFAIAAPPIHEHWK